MFKQMKKSYEMGKALGETKLDTMEPCEREKFQKKISLGINMFIVGGIALNIVIIYLAVKNGWWEKI